MNWLNAVDEAYRTDLRAEMSKGFEKLGSGLLKWLFGFWASAILAFIALSLRA